MKRFTFLTGLAALPVIGCFVPKSLATPTMLVYPPRLTDTFIRNLRSSRTALEVLRSKYGARMQVWSGPFHPNTDLLEVLNARAELNELLSARLDKLPLDKL